MEKKDVKIGDVVVLNSERHSLFEEATLLTVTDKCEEASNIECSWFSGGLAMSEWFPAEALFKVPLFE